MPSNSCFISCKTLESKFWEIKSIIVSISSVVILPDVFDVR